MKRALRHLPSCASTNDEARSWASDATAPAPDKAVVWTDAQTQGRGRQGRSWHSPPGENLYFSCIFRPHLPPRAVPPVTLAMGLALCETVNSLGVAASIKWPNDVWVGERKLAGILTEMSTRGHTLDFVVVGVGLNVNSRAFPADLSATSLALETGREHSRESVLASLLEAMDVWIDHYVMGGVRALQQSFAASSLLSQKRVRARFGDTFVTGIAEDLDDDGALRLRDDGGVLHRILAGDVELCSKEPV